MTRMCSPHVGSCGKFAVGDGEPVVGRSHDQRHRLLSDLPEHVREMPSAEGAVERGSPADGEPGRRRVDRLPAQVDVLGHGHPRVPEVIGDEPGRHVRIVQRGRRRLPERVRGDPQEHLTTPRLPDHPEHIARVTQAAGGAGEDGRPRKAPG